MVLCRAMSHLSICLSAPLFLSLSLNPFPSPQPLSPPPNPSPSLSSNPLISCPVYQSGACGGYPAWLCPQHLIMFIQTRPHLGLQWESGDCGSYFYNSQTHSHTHINTHTHTHSQGHGCIPPLPFPSSVSCSAIAQ